jgi:hypothetical protein
MKPMPPITGRKLQRPDLDLDWWVQELCDAVAEMDALGASTPYGKPLTTARWRTATHAVMQIGGGQVHWWATVKSKTPLAS